MRIRGSWIVVAVVGVLFVTMLLVAGWSNSEIGNDANPERESGGEGTVPSSILRGGSVVDATGDEVVSTGLPDRTIALTFDDGPDPTWTPRVLEVLDRHDVPGTFFVVGSMASRHPELVERIHRSGSELGVHTFTHPDLATTGDWRVERELHQTQLVLAGATGVTTRLFRPPYSSTVGALDDPAYRVVRDAGEHGYVSVFTDVDSQDWRRPGVDAIVDNATPENGRGGTVLLHDAGGDRAQTVAALDVLIPELKRQGYRFTTVSEAVGIDAEHPAAVGDRVSGSALTALVTAARAMMTVLKWALIVVGALTVARLLVLLVLARRHARYRRAHPGCWGEPVRRPVSVLIPAYNEATNIAATVRSAVASDHPVEILVIDDGSTDGTADVVERLGLPGVRVLRLPNGGKAAALNAGVAAASHDLVVMVDGDTLFEPDTVRELVQPFADPTVGAVSGNVKIANRETLLARLQHIEYVVGFNVDRRVYDVTRSMPTVPGAGGAFRREVLEAVGGLSARTLAEDTDLTIAVGRAGWRTVYQETAVTWTEAPTTVRQLWQQRFRWTFGTMQAVFKHRRAIVERGAAGRVGRFGLLHVLAFQVLLPMLAPVIDVFLLYGVLFLDPGTTVLLWLSMLAIQGVGAYCAFGLDRESRSVLWLLPTQQLVYRQLMYVVLVQSVLAAVSGVRVRWQHLRRTGITRPGTVAAPTARGTATAPDGHGGTERGEDTEGRHGTDGPGAAENPAGGRPQAPGPPAPDVAQALDAPKAADAPRAPDSAQAAGFRPTLWAARGSGNPPARSSTAPVPVRERWLDLLRAAALARVLLYHTVGWAWLSVAFPAMGVMFAIGGSLAARSMEHTPPVDVVGSRIRRLLPPVWVLAVVMVPLMLAHGWSTTLDGAGAAGDGGATPLNPPELLLWVFPVLDPPYGEWGLGRDAAIVLWYVRTYLWLVLLSPALLRAYRRWPLVTVAAPLALVAGDAVLGAPLSDLDAVGQGVLDFATFGACWVLGFAHRDGSLARVRPAVLAAVATALVTGGLWWTVMNPAYDGSYDLNLIPLGQALVSTAAVLVLLRVRPPMGWLDRTPVLGRLVTVLNARAVTVYLWHNVAVFLAAPVLMWWTGYSWPAHLAVAVVLTGLAVFAFGWAEDLAARRRVRLLPGGSPPGRHRASRGTRTSHRGHRP
ncbi:glycosyltransferase, partial [Saccharomonospora iraqiensis]|uniref:glycosyltransferase n=1 Tax=Saccharomonospora iraqiensis TaxID=52698 RepID=UPI00022E0EC8